MVTWKGDIDTSKDTKAARLEKLSSLNVPNFFVVSRDEVKRILEAESPSAKSTVKSAFKDIGMSSEVRNASGKAKNLVGGQRDQQQVSLRVNPSSEHSQYKLNVGASNIIDEIKSLGNEHYQENEDYPSILIQKMVEADYSGAAILTEQGEVYVETVAGNGMSIEEGLSTPFILKYENGTVSEVLEPREQVKIERNPVNGRNERKNDQSPSLDISEHEMKDFCQEVLQESFSVKFAYKRGDFFIVDAWKESNKPEILENGYKVSEGAVKGRVSDEVLFSDQTRYTDKHDSVISQKGGFTSRDAEKLRKNGKPAVFSYKEELNPGERVQIGVEESNGFNPFMKPQKDSAPIQNTGSNSMESNSSNSSEAFSVTATEILALNPGQNRRGFHTSYPFGPGIALTQQEIPTQRTVSPENYIESPGKVLKFEGNEFVLDTRQLSDRQVERSLELLESDFSVLIAQDVSARVAAAAVENNVDIIATDRPEDVEKQVLQAEKRFIIDRLREV